MKMRDEHEIVKIGGIEVWIGTSEFGQWLNTICLELSQGFHKVGKSIVHKLPKGWAIFIGANADPQGFSVMHAYIPTLISFNQVVKIVKVLEKDVMDYE